VTHPSVYLSRHARKRPPLPLRFSIYRKDLNDLNKEASSQHPFFLYSLKECLISAVADDFGLRRELDRNQQWSEFETRVVECCDRMIRPYSCIAPVVSARMLLSQGRGATLPANAMAPQPKVIQGMVKRRARQKDHLLATRVAPQAIPFHSWPLPVHHRKMQSDAAHVTVRKAPPTLYLPNFLTHHPY
jgi:hypothetical protein